MSLCFLTEVGIKFSKLVELLFFKRLFHLQPIAFFIRCGFCLQEKHHRQHPSAISHDYLGKDRANKNQSHQELTRFILSFLFHLKLALETTRILLIFADLQVSCVLGVSRVLLEFESAEFLNYVTLFNSRSRLAWTWMIDKQFERQLLVGNVQNHLISVRGGIKLS